MTGQNDEYGPDQYQREVANNTVGLGINIAQCVLYSLLMQ